MIAQAARGPDRAAEKPGLPVRPAVVGAAGGLATGILLIGLFASGAAPAGSFELGGVAPAELAAAAGTLIPGRAPQLVQDARSCRAPLAVVSVARAGPSRAPIRIRSGSYVSPEIVPTDAVQRVALPYPAPYPEGRGTLTVEGDPANLGVYLSPGWRFDPATGTAAISVVWQPRNLC
ncbi:hypothetical protein [Methylobacterium sp. JK268]